MCTRPGGQLKPAEDHLDGLRRLLNDVRNFVRTIFTNVTHVSLKLQVKMMPVCPSLKFVNCDYTVKNAAKFLIPHERTITLDF